MAVTNNLRAVSRALPRVEWLSLIELLLLALLMVQVARLLWVVVTPVGAFGPWTGRQAVIPTADARRALFSSFDPFFRFASGSAGNQVVTSLPLTVYGIRLNEGSGLGSAIVAAPDGVQNSYAVGDEIMPGVVLKSVAFDHIVIDRGGAEESLFLDQSQPAPSAALSAGPAAGASAASAMPDLGAMAIQSDIGFAPRILGGRVTGVTLLPRGAAFEAAGFKPGDVVLQVNGRPIGSVADLQALKGQIVPGGRLSLMVERGHAVVPLSLSLQAQ